jgi:hypothetical protein
LASCPPHRCSQPEDSAERTKKIGPNVTHAAEPAVRPLKNAGAREGGLASIRRANGVDQGLTLEVSAARGKDLRRAVPGRRGPPGRSVRFLQDLARVSSHPGPLRRVVAPLDEGGITDQQHLLRGDVGLLGSLPMPWVSSMPGVATSKYSWRADSDGPEERLEHHHHRPAPVEVGSPDLLLAMERTRHRKRCLSFTAFERFTPTSLAFQSRSARQPS